MPNRDLPNRQPQRILTEEPDDMAGWWPAPEPDHAAQLACMEPIGLDQMDAVALLDRVETKYVFHERRLGAILAAVTGSYRVLEVNGGRLNHYRTLYFDTMDFGLFRRHQAGGRNRYKVRSRVYLDSDLAFLEVKHKVKKNRTVKKRMATPEFVDSLPAQTAGFLARTLPHLNGQLEATLWNEYTRITLVGLDNPERVTLDLNLQFQAGGRTVIMPGVVIAEVKKDGHDGNSAFIRLMRALAIRPTGFSKYCIGLSMLYPHIKHNRFKPKLRMVGKLIQEKENYV